MDLHLKHDRRCLRCRNQFLREKKIENTELVVDECPQCHGIWFDGGELNRLLGDLAAPKHQMPAIGETTSRWVCMVCRTPLKRVYYPDTYVEVDYCPNCGGIWLDQNEFQEIYLVRCRLHANPELAEAPVFRENSLEKLRKMLKDFLDTLLPF